MSKTLAVLGGRSRFGSEPVRFVKPRLPSYESLRPELQAMLESGVLTNVGPHCLGFEKELAEYLGVSQARAVGSGTVALQLLIQALDLEGEVILPSFTFIATAQAAVWSGLTPVFADIHPETFTLDPRSVASLITPNTCAILGVCMFGNPCDIVALQELASQKGLALIFDTAHGIGSLYKGKRLGGFGRGEALSFHATKILPAGEGGAVCSEDAALLDRVFKLRNFGREPTEESLRLGMNGKMTEFAALLGRKQLKGLDQTLRFRRAVAQSYREGLGGVPGIVFQKIEQGAQSNYQNLAVRVFPEKYGLDRDQLFNVLEAEGVESKKYFSPPIHELVYFQTLAQKGQARIGDLRESLALSGQILNLPVHSEMAAEKIDGICEIIAEAHQQSKQVIQRLGQEVLHA
ncbi:MAG: DegT/DnrJ/EryC1/StrS family aminotransferase [Candidatus Omnitrophica bacterium]|nr:DegT/DnrJ/EryC1/StrS family aminotransferase [Candidatus Omnitrophota bacterium]